MDPYRKRDTLKYEELSSGELKKRNSVEIMALNL